MRLPGGNPESGMSGWIGAGFGRVDPTSGDVGAAGVVGRGNTARGGPFTIAAAVGAPLPEIESPGMCRPVARSRRASFPAWAAASLAGPPAPGDFAPLSGAGVASGPALNAPARFPFGTSIGPGGGGAGVAFNTTTLR